MLFGKAVNRYYIRHLPRILLGILALVLVDYMQLVVPELYRNVVNGMAYGFNVIDGVAVAFTKEFLLNEICLPLIVVILSLVFGRFLWRICLFGAGIAIERDLRGRMFDRCKDLSQQYYQVNKVGNMMSLFTNDLETVQECFGVGIMSFADAILLGSLAIIKMARMNLVLTLYSLVPMIFMLISVLTVGRYMSKKWAKRQAAFSSLSDFSQESFSGLAVVKAFVKEGVELLSFRKLNDENEKANVDYTKASTLLRISVTLFVESVICIILGYGGFLVYRGVFNAGQLVEFIGYFTAIVWPVMAVSELIERTSRGKASLARISELLNAEIDVKDSPDVEEVESIVGDIEYRSLSFTYPGSSVKVLDDISFSIKAGESVGIIGRTGAGKTTLIDLLLRTYNVPDGCVFVDGHDVNRIPIKTLRAHTAYVPQDNFLFSDTVANNIAFSTDDPSREDVVGAAVLADIDSNITTFTKGYDTVLGERGVTVSGGQKQRISIARALMKDAPILILDDSVSAVDVKTEKTILENLKNLRRGKTTILIAHRVSTVAGLDKIIFMDDAKLVAMGTHEELYASCDAYRLTVELQKLDEEGGEGNA